MLAIDTDLVVRYLTGDHPTQSAQARKLIDGDDVFVCMTVLLETEWVLRSVYTHAAGPVAKALRAFERAAAKPNFAAISSYLSDNERNLPNM